MDRLEVKEKKSLVRTMSCVFKRNNTNNNLQPPQQQTLTPQLINGKLFPRSNSFNLRVTNSEVKIKVEDEKPKTPSKKKKFMKESTRLMLKLHVIRDKAVKLHDLLKELLARTEEITGDDREADDDEDKQAEFLDKVLEIEAEVKLAKKLMLFLCRHKIMQRHFG